MATILLIDDNLAFLEMISSVLEAAGHRVVCAADGDEGVRLFRAAPSELVITDILMPGKSGVETIQDLHRTSPKIRIIAISGGFHAELDQAEALKRILGVEETLAKPFVPRALLEMVTDVLNREE